MVTVDLLWQRPRQPVALRRNHVHVWRASLDLAPEQLATLRCVLCEDEVSRLERLCFRRDRDRFIAARGTLRVILSRYLSIDPQQVRFQYGPSGKPTLVTPGQPIEFNVSHSNALALYAVSSHGKVGIDVEFSRSIPELRDIAKQFFSPGENRNMAASPAHMKRELFFRYWTRKEAYIKAIGSGLSRPLEEVDVSFGQKELGFRSISQVLLDGAPWCFVDLQPAPDYIAALVVEGGDVSLEYWEEQPDYSVADGKSPPPVGRVQTDE